jgi:hypothetical protein
VRHNESLHPTAPRYGFPEFNVSLAAVAGERGRSASGEAAMSWDLIVMKCREPPPPVAELPTDFAPEVIGPATAIRDVINSAFPHVDWSNPVWGIYMAADYSLEFSLANIESVNTFSVYVRGTGDPITPLTQLAQQNGWYLLNMQIPEWLHLAQDQSASWRQFQAWRDRALARATKD